MVAKIKVGFQEEAQESDPHGSETPSFSRLLYTKILQVSSSGFDCEARFEADQDSNQELKL